MDSSAGPLYQLPCHLQQLQPVAAPHLQGQVPSSMAASVASIPGGQTQPAASLDEKTTFDSGKLAPTVPSVHQQQPMNSQPVSLQPISSHAVHLQALSSNPVHLQPLSTHEPPLQLHPLPSLAVQHSHTVQQPIYTTVHNTVATSGPVYVPPSHSIVKQAGNMFPISDCT